MQHDTFVVIMAGGIGSRFWPYSRNDHPKQFLDILGAGSSLIQMTYLRFLEICPRENIYVVTNKSYYDLVKEQLPEISDDQVLLEPVRRNTGPCIAYASYKIREKNPDACIIVSPSDHAIFKESSFAASVGKAVETAKSDDKLVTLGINPSRPETGYGYIQYYPGEDKSVKKVKTFTEKPQLDLARKFIESGDFVWNSGIFIWRAGTIIKAFEAFLPEVAEIFEEGKGLYYTTEEDAFIRKAYSQSRNISIDYGIMEKASNVYVVLGDFGWSDLGSWNSLYEIKEKDQDHNVLEGNVLAYDSRNCIVKGESDRLIILHDLDGYLVADCNNVTLICKKESEQKFRDFVKDVKAKKGTGFL